MLIVSSDMYTPVLGQSPLIDNLFSRLKKKVSAELAFQRELSKVRGALDMIMAHAVLSTSTTAIA